MPTSHPDVGPLSSSSRQLGKRLLTIGENRLELLAVELQEEVGRLMEGLLLAFGVAALGFLAGITCTATLVVLLWAYAPVGVLVTLTVLYVSGGIYLGRRLTRLLRDWEALAASLGQIRKDRACLEGFLS